MKKYYLHQDGKEVGPFTIEELQAKGINKNTMVWYKNLESWQKASSIEELKDILDVIPPPLQQPIKESSSISKSKLLIATSVILVLSITLVLLKQQSSQDDLKEKIEEQSIKIKEQEKIENSRVEKERIRKAKEEKERKIADLDSLNYLLDQTRIEIDVAKTKLEDIKKFKLLRTQQEKDEQIEMQTTYIYELEKQAQAIQKQIKSYK